MSKMAVISLMKGMVESGGALDVVVVFGTVQIRRKSWRKRCRKGIMVRGAENQSHTCAYHAYVRLTASSQLIGLHGIVPNVPAVLYFRASL